MFLLGKLIVFIMCVMSLSVLAQTEVESAGFSFSPSLAFNSDFYIESNLEFTLLHELAHAVIEVNNIPVLGGHEQAADQVALMMLLTDQRHKGALTSVSLNKLLAISGEWFLEWQTEMSNNQAVYWDAHPLTIQRFYDVTCLAYGSNPDVLESLRKEKWLPVERAWNCDLEFKKTRQALAWLTKKVSHYELDSNWNFVKKNNPPEGFTGQVKIVWVEPTRQSHMALAKKLKSFTSLKYLVEQTNEVLNLKKNITIYMEPYCKGPDAWWNGEQSIITVCYELAELFSKNAKLLPELVNKGLPE